MFNDNSMQIKKLEERLEDTRKLVFENKIVIRNLLEILGYKVLGKSNCHIGHISLRFENDSPCCNELKVVKINNKEKSNV